MVYEDKMDGFLHFSPPLKLYVYNIGHDTVLLLYVLRNQAHQLPKDQHVKDILIYESDSNRKDSNFLLFYKPFTGCVCMHVWVCVDISSPYSVCARFGISSTSEKMITFEGL